MARIAANGPKRSRHEEETTDGHRFTQINAWENLGNSLRSDVLPALQAGAFAAHIPYPLTWAHEMAETPTGHDRFTELASITELPATPTWLTSTQCRPI